MNDTPTACVFCDDGPDAKGRRVFFLFWGEESPAVPRKPQPGGWYLRAQIFRAEPRDTARVFADESQALAWLDSIHHRRPALSHCAK